MKNPPHPGLTVKFDCLAGILAYNGTAAICLGERLWAITLSMLLS